MAKRFATTSKSYDVILPAYVVVLLAAGCFIGAAGLVASFLYYVPTPADAFSLKGILPL